MLKKLKLLKKPLFQKRRWSCDFPPRNTPVAQKHCVISCQEKMAFSAPVGLSWDSPPPPTESVRTDRRTDVRMYGRTDVRTDGHVTIMSQPKFLGLIGYQISLAMELRWRALPAGSANIHKWKEKVQKNTGRRRKVQVTKAAFKGLHRFVFFTAESLPCSET